MKLRRTNTCSSVDVADETEQAHEVLVTAASMVCPFAESAVPHPWVWHPDRVRYERLGGYDGVLVRLATLSASTRKLLSGALADVENERAQSQFAAALRSESDAIGGPDFGGARLAGNLLTVNLLTIGMAHEGSWQPAHVESSADTASMAVKPNASAAVPHGPIGFGASRLCRRVVTLARVDGHALTATSLTTSFRALNSTLLIDAAIAPIFGACCSVAWLGLTQLEAWACLSHGLALARLGSVSCGE